MARRRGTRSQPARSPRPAACAGLLLVVAVALIGSAPAAAVREASGRRWTTTAATPAQDVGDGLDIIGQVGGSAYSVALEGERLYVGLGPRIVVFDVAGEGEPVVIGQSPVLPSVVRDLVVDGDIVYAVSRAGLSIVDFRDPQAARVNAFVPSQEPSLSDGWRWPDPLLALGDGTLYVAPSPYEPVRVLDVAAPERPTEVSTLHVAEPPRALSAIAVDGTLVYLAYSGGSHPDTDGSVAVFDVADPRAPQRLGSTTFGAGRLGGMTVAGGYVLLSRSECALEVLDASDPAQLVAEGCSNWDVRGAKPRIASHGSLAFAMDGDTNSLWIVDWSDPRAPELVGHLQVGAADVAIDASRGRWFVAAAESGLLAYAAEGLLDAEQQSEATVDDIDTTHRSVLENHLAVVGDAVLVGVSGGTRVFDIADSGELDHAAVIPLELTSRPVVLDDAMVLLPHRDAVHVYDLSHPAAPQPLGVFTATGSVRTMTVAGHRVVLTGEADLTNGFIEVVDYAMPAAPRRVGQEITWAGTYRAAAVEGDRLYLSLPGRLDVWDIGRPGQPEWVANVGSASDWFDDLLVRGGYLYGTRSSRLSILDARAIDSVREVFTTDVLAGRYLQPGSLTFVDDTLVMPWRNLRLGAWLFDVSDPSRPRPAGVFGAGGDIDQLTVSGDRVVYLWDEDPYSGSDPLRLRIAGVDGVMDVRLDSRHASVGYAESVAVNGDLALVTGWPDGLKIVDVAAPDAPRLLSTVPLPKGADRVAADDGFAYVVSPLSWEQDDGEASTVHVVDISDPSRPYIASSMRRHGGVFELTVADGRLYLAEASGLTIFDLRSDPGHPLELGRLPSRADVQQRVGAVTHVVAAGHRAVVVDAVYMDWDDPSDDGEADEVRVVDVSDPARPTLIGAVTLGTASSWSRIRGFDLAWPHAFAVTSQVDKDMNAVVHAIDVAQPNGPRIEAAWQSPELRYATSLAVAANRVFVGSWFGIEVLDRTVVLDPRRVAKAITPGISLSAAELAVDSSGRVYLANGVAGLVVLEVDQGSPPEPRQSRLYLPRAVRPASF